MPKPISGWSPPPRHNHLVQNAARLYSSFLAKPGKSEAPFISIELEQVIETAG